MSLLNFYEAPPIRMPVSSARRDMFMNRTPGIRLQSREELSGQRICKVPIVLEGQMHAHCVKMRKHQFGEPSKFCLMP